MKKTDGSFATVVSCIHAGTIANLYDQYVVAAKSAKQHVQKRSVYHDALLICAPRKDGHTNSSDSVMVNNVLRQQPVYRDLILQLTPHDPVAREYLFKLNDKMVHDVKHMLPAHVETLMTDADRGYGDNVMPRDERDVGRSRSRELALALPRAQQRSRSRSRDRNAAARSASSSLVTNRLNRVTANHAPLAAKIHDVKWTLGKRGCEHAHDTNTGMCWNVPPSLFVAPTPTPTPLIPLPVKSFSRPIVDGEVPTRRTRPPPFLISMLGLIALWYLTTASSRRDFKFSRYTI